jgi:GxxExxY protein
LLYIIFFFYFEGLLQTVFFNTAMVNKNLKYSDITEKIIGSAFQVHSFLGNGFQEFIYQRALAIEMQNKGLGFARELEVPVFYNEVEIGTRRVDFLVQDKILVEIKAITELNEIHYAQIINYLKAYKLQVGLLINFGGRSLRFKRFIKSETIQSV